jgi:hypothetical protein
VTDYGLAGWVQSITVYWAGFWFGYTLIDWLVHR